MSRWLVVLIVTVLLILPGPLLAQEPDSPNPVDALAWSPEGGRLAVGYDNGILQILDVSSGQVLHTLQGHSNKVWSLSWKPDGSQLISGSFDGTARIWDTFSGQLIATLPTISPTATLAVTWNLEGNQIITYGFDVTLNFRIWDASTYEQIYAEPRGGDVIQIIWSPDHTQVALANAAGQVIITSDVVTYENVLRFDEPETSDGAIFGVYAVAWSPDGNYVASGNFAGDVRLWNVTSGQILLNLNATDSLPPDRTTTLVRALSFSPDGSQLTSVATDGTFRNWDVTTGQLLDSVQLSAAPIFAAAWSPDGTKLAYGGPEGVVIQVEPASRQPTSSDD